MLRHAPVGLISTAVHGRPVPKGLAGCLLHTRLLSVGLSLSCVRSNQHPGLIKQTTPWPLPSAPSTKFVEPTYDFASSGTQSKVPKAPLLPVYARPEFVLSHGKGSYIWDTEGRRYLDFSAGIAVNALGHADEGVLKASTITIKRFFEVAGMLYIYRFSTNKRLKLSIPAMCTTTNGRLS